MEIASSSNAATVVIFGASGDLARRKLVPALHSLACSGLLPAAARIVGVARTPLEDDGFRDRLYEGVEKYARLDPKVCRLWSDFAERHSYLQGMHENPMAWPPKKFDFSIISTPMSKRARSRAAERPATPPPIITTLLSITFVFKSPL